MGDRKFEPGKATPLSFATINPHKNKLYAPCENCHTFRTNKKEFKRMKQLTYHHIKPKIHGGVESEENGAILSEENHLWFHSQEKEIQEILNESFKKYQKFYEVKRKVNSNFKPTDLLNENDFITLSKEVCAQIFEIKYLKKHDKSNIVDTDLVI